MSKVEHFKNADIRVLMLGASRVGKTSLLSLISNEDIVKLALRGTDLELKKTNIDLSGTCETMKNYFKLVDENGKMIRSRHGEFVLNDGPNQRIEEYSMEITTKGKEGTHKIAFTDIVGEDLRKMHDNLLTNDEIKNIKDPVTLADVVIITIDSVLMMENEGLNAVLGNNINEVCDLITKCCSPQEGSFHKLFLFVPVKCEKYYNQHLQYLKDHETYTEDPMITLIERIEKYYKVAFDYLAEGAGRNYFQAAILPVLTLGDIQFRWFADTSLTKSVLDASDMLFEYSSRRDPIKHTMLAPAFKPEYCDQILVYILLFQLAKIKAYNDNRAFFKKVLDIFTNGLKNLASNKSLIEQAPKLSKNLCVEEQYVRKIIQNPIRFINDNK